MSAVEAFQTATNWIVIVGVVILLSVVVASWLASYRMSKAAPVGSGKRPFALPAWAQIGAGLAVSALLAYLGYLLWIPLRLVVSPEVLVVLRIVGLTLFLAGLLLTLWARWALGAMYGVSTSFAAQLQAGHRLIQHGSYAFVRHPMYLGYWLVLTGVMLTYRTM